ncbi:Hypothetical protein D9617_9g026260 [Elsinoe fawcettii]|nr:Hypothetical protein D9617_9g026260 [Elsinoe fawcettii]
MARTKSWRIFACFLICSLTLGLYIPWAGHESKISLLPRGKAPGSSPGSSSGPDAPNLSGPSGPSNTLPGNNKNVLDIGDLQSPQDGPRPADSTMVSDVVRHHTNNSPESSLDNAPGSSQEYGDSIDWNDVTTPPEEPANKRSRIEEPDLGTKPVEGPADTQTAQLRGRPTSWKNGEKLLNYIDGEGQDTALGFVESDATLNKFRIRQEAEDAFRSNMNNGQRRTLFSSLYVSELGGSVVGNKPYCNGSRSLEDHTKLAEALKDDLRWAPQVQEKVMQTSGKTVIDDMTPELWIRNTHVEDLVSARLMRMDKQQTGRPADERFSFAPLPAEGRPRGSTFGW